jgi:site-specific recombinase XerD
MIPESIAPKFRFSSVRWLCFADANAVGTCGAALPGVLCADGLHRAELVALNLFDLESETKKLVIRSSKARTVQVGGEALAVRLNAC